MREALTKLIKVKTIVTLILTVVFAYLCCVGKVEAKEFVMIFTVVISFYFGSQYEKGNKTSGADEE